MDVLSHPLRQASRIDINTLLKEESRTSSFRLGRFSRIAVVGQIALVA